MLAIKDGNGRSIFLTANEAPAPGGIGSILGYPVTLAHAAPSTNTAGNVIAVFGDPNGLVHGVRQDFEFKSSADFYFADNEIAFRAIARNMAKVRSATAFAKLTLAAA